MYVCTRPYDHEGDVSDRNVRVWQISMHRHVGLVCAIMSYNVKKKSCNSVPPDDVYLHIIRACALSLSSYPILLLPVSTPQAVARSGGWGCCGAVVEVVVAVIIIMIVVTL